MLRLLVTVAVDDGHRWLEMVTEVWRDFPAGLLVQLSGSNWSGLTAYLDHLGRLSLFP